LLLSLHIFYLRHGKLQQMCVGFIPFLQGLPFIENGVIHSLPHLSNFRSRRTIPRLKYCRVLPPPPLCEASFHGIKRIIKQGPHDHLPVPLLTLGGSLQNVLVFLSFWFLSFPVAQPRLGSKVMRKILLPPRSLALPCLPVAASASS